MNITDYDDTLQETIEKRKKMYDYLNTNNFELFCTFQLPNDNIENAEMLLKKWRSNFCTQEHIQIAYKGIAVTSKFTVPHIHLLMLGKNKNGKTLYDIDIKKWQKEWARLTYRRKNKIEMISDLMMVPVDNLHDRISYICRPKNMIPGKYEQIIPFNKNLLKKTSKTN